MRLAASLARGVGIAALFLAAALFGTAGGVLFAFVGDLPQISALDDYTPGTITRVLGRDGAIVGEFATERRVVVTYDQIPVVLRNALVAAEDGDFFHHPGVDVRRIAATAFRRAVGLQRRGGASTITQQLARKLFLTDEVTPERKIKEALLAIQIEKRYTKEEILTMYCNKMYWGHGIYGVEAASQLYFGKSVKDLTLDEAAMIAGIHQSNVRQSPYTNMAAAVARRNYTLDRMADEGFVRAEEAAAAKKRPIVTRGRPTPPPSIAPYFLETIRTQLEERYGSKAIYEGGLVVHTGIDAELQRAANLALDNGIRRLDKLRGYRKPSRNVLQDGRSIDTFRHPRWTHDPMPAEVMPAVVTEVTPAELRVRVGRFAGTIAKAGYQWTNRPPSQLARRGDLIEVRIGKVDDKTASFAGALEQTPVLEGAVVAIENRTGQLLALVGGTDFERTQFNRATQALRQVGSLFKPFVYATAIDRGYTPISLIDDSPASFDAGPGQPPYQPQNYDHEYHGMVTLRAALEESRNIPTIRLMAALGPREVVRVARQMGITSPLPEYLSVAIGSAEATLLEIASAYTAFPNQGVRMAPTALLDVVDRDGNTLEQHRVEPHEALRADTAYVMTSLLQGVVEHGTAQAARALNWPLGGKTGTTDDYSDAWFMGFDPDITLGVWIGYDQKRPIGHNQTGAVAALPIWQEIMKSWVERQRAARPEPPTFPRPENIVTVNVAGGPEVFIAGTEPGAR
ncbi:MAG: PBP1A family penicillin-binding protein [Acidobacteria bacterium]|nr:PBP1A family penicillin-binding protein [Acidobacteriota bacterium]